ncbi:MAG TPA: globin [Candidatus Limnocylindrales bacterium]
MIAEPSLYDAVGGMPFFEELVDRFYEGVAGDPELLALYPQPGDLGPARHRLTLFLAQYWGGPTDYDAERGHPRLRMRHAPFAIGPADRDRWLLHMQTAIAACAPPRDVARRLDAYFEMAADAMRNRD